MNENTEEWIGRIWLAAVGFNYIEIDRQLKEQFIHGLNDNEMISEITRELTKKEENKILTSHQVLAWAKRTEAQRAQSAIINSLSKTKDFDRIKE